MPIYAFECKKCKHQFEELCSMDDRTKVKCEKCKSKKVHQMISQVHILGPTSSKKGNFEWGAKDGFEKAQNESRTAREEAVKRGLSPYRNIDDISSGTNFDPASW